MKYFALLFSILGSLVGSYSHADLLQEFEKKADEIEHRAETLKQEAQKTGHPGGKAKLDLANPNKTPYYLGNNETGASGETRKSHVLAVKEVKSYDGTEGTQIVVGGQSVAEATNFASALRQKLEENAVPMKTDHGMLEDDCKLRQGATCEVISSATTKFSTGLSKQSGGAKVLLNWHGLVPFLDSRQAESLK